MRYYMIVEGNYIVAVGTGDGYTEISKEVYDDLMYRIENRPVAPEGYKYRLRTDYEWELVEKVIEEEELSDDDLLNILLEGDAE